MPAPPGRQPETRLAKQVQCTDGLTRRDFVSG